MLVASGAEFGDDGKTAVALLPQVIGNIQTAIGYGTLTCADGVAAQVMVGDPVCAGDAIETGPDGRIEIRFIDGTVFNLSGDSRVVVREFVCDRDRADSALFAVTKGTFAFIGGRAAKTGSLWVDTPVGSIRGRPHAGGFGMLSLAALLFSFVKEAQAADPDVTFLDDDRITYKDFDHGVFELVTKEAIPRHIIVEDPGETIVLSKTGSSVGVNQVANTPARMEELQAAQQDALANFAKAWGPNGSSTPPFLNPQQLLQPINFIQTDTGNPQNSLPPLEAAAFNVQDIIIVHQPPPPPIPPTLNLGTGPTEIDTVVFDTFAATRGTFSASSANSDATLTFGISGENAVNTVLGEVTYNVSNAGQFGTLYVNSTTGAYTFVPNDDAINALKANTTQSFIITVSDGTLSVAQPFSIPIVGADDAAIISGTTTGSVVGTGGVNNASPGLLFATGTLTDVDVDDPANTFAAVSSPTKSAGGYGTFTMTAAGVWTYSLDNANSTVRALDVGGTLTDTFTVTSIDGTPQVVTIIVHGPLIAGTGTAPSLTLSETHLTATALDDNIAGSAPDAALTTTTGDFSTAFTSVQGADGATISYALSIVGGNSTASGLIDSLTGLIDVLVLNGNTIEGRVNTTGGTLAFTITLDPTTGLVTFTEYRAVTQPFGTNPDGGEGVSLTAGIVNLIATVTNKDGDFQTISVDLGKQLTVTDDGPSITATGTAPLLTLSETHLTAMGDNNAGSVPNAAMTTTGDFSTAFTSAQGADGATISYALSITGGNGEASGLIDSHTGLADVLVLNGNTIQGRVGTTGGTLAFTITLDPTMGLVTFTEYRAVTQPFGTNPDGGEGVSLTAGIVNLVATVTDKDGDFQTASLDLGKQLTITDDGPTIGGFEQAFLAAQDNQIANGTYNVNFGADGGAAMLVAVQNGAVGSTGYDLATSSLGGGITLVHVTGNGDDYTFYYSTHAVSGGVELDAYLTDTNGTLTDPYFTLLINPDGTYSFDLESVELLKQVTVTGSSFGASGSGTPSLTAPDGRLVITGSDNSGHPVDVKASNNGIAVGDTGLQMDPNEDLHLTFAQEQSKVSFNLTQWQGSGTADVIFKVLDGTTDVHDFNINIPKPSGGITNIVVQETSNAALIDTYTFDSATSTYTLYVQQTFNQIQVDYHQAVTGNATFTINNITYDETSTIPSTDLLFEVSAVDGDGDSATTTLQVNLQGGTTLATALPLTGISGSDPPVSSNDATTILSSTTTTSLTEPAGITPSTPIATGAFTDSNVDNAPNTFTMVSSPTKSDRGYETLPMMAAGVSVYAPDYNSATVIGDMLNDAIIGGFGAVLLTGGNGSDTFGNSSVVDSNAAQFDTITDLASGSDRIDLTSFGALALAILALSPTSTSVPAHTIAWLFHSATNETIVYVNPTDQTLSIGDTGLVEIHLAGVSSIEASDFVLAPAVSPVVADNASIDPAATTASDATIAPTVITDILSSTIGSDGTFLAAANSATHTTNVGEGIDTTHDKATWIDDPEYASSDEVPTKSIEHTVDETVISLPSGRTVDLPHVSLMAQTEIGFAFDHLPGFDRTDTTAIVHSAAMHGPALEIGDWTLPPNGHWQIDSASGYVGNEGNGASTQKTLGSMDEAVAHDHPTDFDSNPKGVKASENGVGNHSISSEAGVHGAPAMHGAGAHDAEPSSIDVDSNAVPHPGGLNALENGIGSHSISSEAGVHGASAMHGAGAHDVAPPSIAHAVFGSGAVDRLGIGDSFHFKDETSSLGVSGVIDHAAPDQVPAISHHDDATGTHRPLAVQPLDLPVPASADDMSIVADHGKSHLVSNAQHDLII